MADTGFDFAFAIRVSYATRQSDGTVMLQHIAVERIERGIVDVRRDHAFAKIIEHDHTSHTTQPAKRFSCSSAQTRVLERNTNNRTDFRLCPNVGTNNRVRRYLPLSGSRTIGPEP